MVKTKNIFTYFLTIFVLQSVLPVLTRHIDYSSSKCYKDLNKLKNTCNADIDHYSKSLNKLTNEITQLTSSKFKYEICINKPELKKCSDENVLKIQPHKELLISTRSAQHAQRFGDGS